MELDKMQMEQEKANIEKEREDNKQQLQATIAKLDNATQALQAANARAAKLESALDKDLQVWAFAVLLPVVACCPHGAGGLLKIQSGAGSGARGF